MKENAMDEAFLCLSLSLSLCVCVLDDMMDLIRDELMGLVRRRRSMSFPLFGHDSQVVSHHITQHGT